MQLIQQLQYSHDPQSTVWLALIMTSEVSSLRRVSLLYFPGLLKMLMGFIKLN